MLQSKLSFPPLISPVCPLFTGDEVLPMFCVPLFVAPPLLGMTGLALFRRRWNWRSARLVCPHRSWRSVVSSVLLSARAL